MGQSWVMRTTLIRLFQFYDHTQKTGVISWDREEEQARNLRYLVVRSSVRHDNCRGGGRETVGFLSTCGVCVRKGCQAEIAIYEFISPPPRKQLPQYASPHSSFWPSRLGFYMCAPSQLGKDSVRGRPTSEPSSQMRRVSRL